MSLKQEIFNHLKSKYEVLEFLKEGLYHTSCDEFHEFMIDLLKKNNYNVSTIENNKDYFTNIVDAYLANKDVNLVIDDHLNEIRELKKYNFDVSIIKPGLPNPMRFSITDSKIVLNKGDIYSIDKMNKITQFNRTMYRDKKGIYHYNQNRDCHNSPKIRSFIRFDKSVISNNKLKFPIEVFKFEDNNQMKSLGIERWYDLPLEAGAYVIERHIVVDISEKGTVYACDGDCEYHFYKKGKKINNTYLDISDNKIIFIGHEYTLNNIQFIQESMKQIIIDGLGDHIKIDYDSKDEYYYYDDFILKINAI